MPELFTEQHLGHLIAGKGIYLGVWQPLGRDGNPIGKKYNLFASSEDLKDKAGNTLFAYQEAAQEVARLTKYRLKTKYFEDDKALYAALADGSGERKWFIPPLELLNGMNLKIDDRGEHHFNKEDGHKNLFALRNHGDFYGTFVKNPKDPARFYWSCTEDHDDIMTVDFSDGLTRIGRKSGNAGMRVRPCYVELAP
jgi:hypothetical protein